MGVADVRVHPVDHAGDADAITHPVKRMVIHVRDRWRTRAKTRRASRHAIERLAEPGEGSALDSIGDDLEEAIQKWRIVISGLGAARERVWNFAESCAGGIVL